jgi:nuclear pore complex protein Nup93
VRAYLQLKCTTFVEARFLQVHNGIPVWALLFYLIRCGLWQEALNYCQQMEGYLEKTDMNFVHYLRTFIDHGCEIPKHLQQAIQESVFEKIGDVMDPFKKTILCYISGIKQEHLDKQVIATVEDYIWMHLRLAVNGTSSLEELQKSILALSSSSFGKNPLSYFLILLSVGELERVAGCLI